MSQDQDRPASTLDRHCSTCHRPNRSRCSTFESARASFERLSRAARRTNALRCGPRIMPRVTPRDRRRESRGCGPAATSSCGIVFGRIIFLARNRFLPRQQVALRLVPRWPRDGRPRLLESRRRGERRATSVPNANTALTWTWKSGRTHVSPLVKAPLVVLLSPPCRGSRRRSL